MLPGPMQTTDAGDGSFGGGAEAGIKRGRSRHCRSEGKERETAQGRRTRPPTRFSTARASVSSSTLTCVCHDQFSSRAVVVRPAIAVVLLMISGIGNTRPDRTHELRHLTNDVGQRRSDVGLAAICMGRKVGDDHGNRTKFGVVAEHEIAVPLEEPESTSREEFSIHTAARLQPLCIPSG